MSHFKAWVIVPHDAGNGALVDVQTAVSERLRAYDESLVVDPWEVGPVSDEALDEFLEFYTGLDCWTPDLADRLTGAMQLPERAARVRAVYALLGQHYNRNRWVEGEDGIWREFSRVNRVGRWDYWTIGGRYDGSLLAWAGDRDLVPVNVARVGDVDLVRMAEARRRESIQAMAAFTSGETAAFFDGDVAAAREALGFPEDMTADQWITRRQDPRPAVLVRLDGSLLESGFPTWPTSPRATEDSVFRWRQDLHLALAAADRDLLVVVDCHTETAVL